AREEIGRGVREVEAAGDLVDDAAVGPFAEHDVAGGRDERVRVRGGRIGRILDADDLAGGRRGGGELGLGARRAGAGAPAWGLARRGARRRRGLLRLRRLRLRRLRIVRRGRGGPRRGPGRRRRRGALAAGEDEGEGEEERAPHGLVYVLAIPRQRR